jgi:hypothetical protein
MKSSLHGPDFMTSAAASHKIIRAALDSYNVSSYLRNRINGILDSDSPRGTWKAGISWEIKNEFDKALLAKSRSKEDLGRADVRKFSMSNGGSLVGGSSYSPREQTDDVSKLVASTSRSNLLKEPITVVPLHAFYSMVITKPLLQGLFIKADPVDENDDINNSMNLVRKKIYDSTPKDNISVVAANNPNFYTTNSNSVDLQAPSTITHILKPDPKESTLQKTILHTNYPIPSALHVQPTFSSLIHNQKMEAAQDAQMVSRGNRCNQCSVAVQTMPLPGKSISTQTNDVQLFCIGEREGTRGRYYMSEVSDKRKGSFMSSVSARDHIFIGNWKDKEIVPIMREIEGRPSPVKSDPTTPIDPVKKYRDEESESLRGKVVFHERKLSKSDTSVQMRSKIDQQENAICLSEQESKNNAQDKKVSPRSSIPNMPTKEKPGSSREPVVQKPQILYDPKKIVAPKVNTYRTVKPNKEVSPRAFIASSVSKGHQDEVRLDHDDICGLDTIWKEALRETSPEVLLTHSFDKSPDKKSQTIIEKVAAADSTGPLLASKSSQLKVKESGNSVRRSTPPRPPVKASQQQSASAREASTQPLLPPPPPKDAQSKKPNPIVSIIKVKQAAQALMEKAHIQKEHYRDAMPPQSKILYEFDLLDHDDLNNLGKDLNMQSPVQEKPKPFVVRVPTQSTPSDKSSPAFVQSKKPGRSMK